MARPHPNQLGFSFDEPAPGPAPARATDLLAGLVAAVDGLHDSDAAAMPQVRALADRARAAVAAPATIDERASAMVVEAMKCCHRPGAPLPFNRIVSSRIRKAPGGPIAEADVILFDDGLASFECQRIGKFDAWQTYWVRMDGEPIELVDGSWRRVSVKEAAS